MPYHVLTVGSKVYMLASTVSSKFTRSLAKEEGFNFEVTLHFSHCSLCSAPCLYRRH